MDIDLYIKIMNKLCDILIQLDDIQKDIKCVKEQSKSKSHNGDHWSSSCEMKHTDIAISVKGEYYD